MCKTVLILGVACAACLVATAKTYDLSKGGIAATVETAPDRVDVGRDFLVTVSANAPIPDLRDRFRGFAVAEDYAEEPLTEQDGTTRYVTRWRLVPEPAAERYALKPFALEKGGEAIATARIIFEAPPAREAVTGGIETDLQKDFPPLSAKLVGQIALALVLVALLVWGLIWVIRKIIQMVRVHRMSPIQRAYWELARLLEKGLPGRGHYKDFYVELTLVVRRYIQRKYGISAPNMTTEEFLATAHPSDELKAFLESADLVKFAGVEATPEMADRATESARGYLESDNADKKTER